MDKCSSNASNTPPNLHKCAHACTSHSSHCSLLTVALLSALDDAVPGVLGCEGAATGTSLCTVSCRRTSGALPRSPSIAAVSPLECSAQSSRQVWLGVLPVLQASSANRTVASEAAHFLVTISSEKVPRLSQQRHTPHMTSILHGCSQRRRMSAGWGDPRAHGCAHGEGVSRRLAAGLARRRLRR